VGELPQSIQNAFLRAVQQCSYLEKVARLTRGNRKEAAAYRAFPANGCSGCLKNTVSLRR